jgi:hypothetical protein
MDGWNYNFLWQKAKLYIDRALSEDREGPLFPFWAALALELLARATLAKVHPVLLAEPDCILMVFGYDTGDKVAKSVMAKTVFLRCQKVVPDFGETELKTSMSIVERRNEELHSGTLAFEEFPTRVWLSSFYRICKLLLTAQGQSLASFLGKDEADAAEKMIVASEKETLASVQKIVGVKKYEFEKLESTERPRKYSLAETSSREFEDPSKRLETCPACGGDGVITGERVRAGTARLEGDSMYQDIAFLPTKFRCYSCDLELAGHAFLHAAGLGGQYSVTERYDPVQYYGEMFMDDLAADAESMYQNE